MDAAAVAISHRRAQEKAGTAELIALSQLSPEPACQKLATNPVGLAEDEAARRLKAYGPNLVTREQKPTILQEIWGRDPKSAERAPAHAGGGLLFPRRPARPRSSSPSWSSCCRRHRLRSGAPVQRGGGAPAGDGEDDGERAARAAAPACGRFCRSSDRDAGAGRCRAAVGRRHDPGRPAAARGQGSVRQPVRADRRSDAGGEIRACLRRADCDDPFDLPNICFMGANVVSGYGDRRRRAHRRAAPISASWPTRSPAGACRPPSTRASTGSPG